MFRPDFLYCDSRLCPVPGRWEVGEDGPSLGSAQWDGERRAVHSGAEALCEGGPHKGQEPARGQVWGSEALWRLSWARGAWGTSSWNIPSLSAGCEIRPRAHLPARAQIFSTVITVESVSFAGNWTWVRVPAPPFTSSASRQVTSALLTFQSSGSSGG